MPGLRSRGVLLALCLANTLLEPAADPASARAAILQPAVVTPEFRAWIEALWPEAEARDVSRPLFDSTFAGVVTDPSVISLTLRQPEFAKPIGTYLAAQVTSARIAQGKDRMVQWRSVLERIEKRYGVPPEIVVALWGLESNFGVAAGAKDVIRSLATLASIGYRPDLMRGELLAALVLLQRGDVPRGNLRGSWAGAMGQPQFMPSSFEKYAVDGDGDGRRDIWTNVPDVLSSIANFLHQQGYQADRPWGYEVRVPVGFDLRTSRGSFADWTDRGVRRADGRALPGPGDATLFYPAGSAGPAFLVTANFEVLKTYNFSDAYVLSVGMMADRMTGGAPIAASWPPVAGMARESRIALQAALADGGYPVDNREGRISLALRDTIRTAQAAVGLVPDGNATDDLLERLRGLPRRP